MEAWQRLFIEAADILNLEASVHGQGLPGSYVSIALGDVYLDYSDEDELTDENYGPYKDMHIMIRPTNGRAGREALILQAPVDGLIHPHINVPYFCFGGNARNITQWCKDGDWLVLLNNLQNLVKQYWSHNAYQRAGRQVPGCSCLARLRDGDDSAVREIVFDEENEDDEEYVCNRCRHNCDFCGSELSIDDHYTITVGERSHNICGKCVHNESLSFCPSCGSITTEVMKCSITGFPICRSCAYRSVTDGALYHRDGFSVVAGDRYDVAPITEGTFCLKCRLLVPNPGSRYTSTCRDLRCGADVLAIINQAREANDGSRESGERKVFNTRDEYEESILTRVSARKQELANYTASLV